ncbi:NAD(P)/FAD-dependent oxidoreductase [Microbacterium murale]|uniref:3-phenylpropionate/trans-cinnamate dioxygenase ferredoxin reductase subunit n=1 Tax=Microbacterium murale TaxID=1081040 RepID=A0ABU0PDD4_9MICO|nr:NAD(P)/FAD-dependent oxidoreductase [Microbacterium murale]MDQ0645325.1 3-phenylpropionate/trans-cinnamate dioxygenase ferredoxin reductase subunit [Microbacterium murale]
MTAHIQHFQVIIVGASLAGLTAAESLRDEGFSGSIAVIGEEMHAPYLRPSLSKQVLKGVWGPTQAAIREPSQLADLDIALMLGRGARRLDIAGRTIEVGERVLGYEDLIIATGAVARGLETESVSASDPVHALRTLDDAIALRGAMSSADRIAIVGAGVLGCEIASVARGAGVDTVMIGRAPTLSFGGLGTALSPRIVSLLAENGVELRLGSAVSAARARAQGGGVRLADGSLIEADLVVAAVGCRPAVDWLRGSGLEIADGVVCDAHGRAAPHVFAVGDVAAWFDASSGTHQRVEHQQNAIEQAQAVARSLVHGIPSAPIIPFFWSELFGTRILSCGRVSHDATISTLHGDPQRDRFVLAATYRGAVEGLIGWNMPREFRLARADLLASSGERHLISAGRGTEYP